MSKFIFSIQFNYINREQVTLESYNYSYTDDFISQTIKSDTLKNNLYQEIEDYYYGTGFTYSIGPAGGGLSASYYSINDISLIEDYSIVEFRLAFDSDKIDNNALAIISYDLKNLIRIAFSESSSIVDSIILDPETGLKSEIQTGGVTYSLPTTIPYNLILDQKDDSVNDELGAINSGGWKLLYNINQIEPGKPAIQVAPLISESATQSSTQSYIIDGKSYLFNVNQPDIFSSLEFGDLLLLGEGVIIDEFIFQEEIDFIDSEYTEEIFMGEDEIFSPTLDYVSTNSEFLNLEKGFNPDNPDESLLTESKYPVSKDKEANIKSILSALNKKGVTNKYTQAAILAIVSKETGFIPRNETSYKNTPSDRIKKIFASFRRYSNSEVDQIKNNIKQFFDIAYGGKYGNSSTEGYKYRGRGFNQLTFKGNYSSMAKKIGVDIVSDPDLLNKVEYASMALAQYFIDRFKSMPDSLRSKYKTSGSINDFKRLEDATGAVYHANAGWGKSYEEVIADSTGGRKKAFSRVNQLYQDYTK